VNFFGLASLEHFAVVNDNAKARFWEALDDTSDKLLEDRKGPSRSL
jgi:isocitrate dehydrogenase